MNILLSKRSIIDRVKREETWLLTKGQEIKTRAEVLGRRGGVYIHD